MAPLRNGDRVVYVAQSPPSAAESARRRERVVWREAEAGNLPDMDSRRCRAPFLAARAIRVGERDRYSAPGAARSASRTDATVLAAPLRDVGSERDRHSHPDRLSPLRPAPGGASLRLPADAV